MTEKMVEITGFEELLRDIGKLNNLNDKLYWPVHDAMSEAVQRIEGQAKENLTDGGQVAFGNLRASVGSYVELSETTITGVVGSGQLAVGSPSTGSPSTGSPSTGSGDVGYAAVVEYGSRPHWAPLQPLVEWVRVKRMAGVYSLKTRRRMGSKAKKQAEDVELAQRMRSSIARKGTQAHPFFWRAVEAKKEEVYGLFEEAVGKMVELFNQGKGSRQ